MLFDNKVNKKLKNLLFNKYLSPKGCTVHLQSLIRILISGTGPNNGIPRSELINLQTANTSQPNYYQPQKVVKYTEAVRNPPDDSSNSQYAADAVHAHQPNRDTSQTNQTMINLKIAHWNANQ